MKIIFALFLLIPLCSSAQYTFDYRLEYQLIHPQSDSIRTYNYYINSTDNDYVASITKLPNGTFEFIFRSQNISTWPLSIAGDYKNPVSLTLKDSMISSFKSMQKEYEKIAKKYDIDILSDTLIENKTYTRIAFSLIKSKRNKRKKSPKEVYIIDTTKKMQPFFVRLTILEIWRLRKKVPEGLVKEKHVYDDNGNLSWSEKLKEISPIDFTISIEK